jgi:hypothetical protein
MDDILFLVFRCKVNDVLDPAAVYKGDIVEKARVEIGVSWIRAGRARG